MSWRFLHIQRITLASSDNWGTLFILDRKGVSWEKLCYTYELPWIEDESGKSKEYKSRIRIGEYELKPHTTESQGWVLILKGTGHRTGILIHRAHKTMKIEGCILPVHFSNFQQAGLKKGDKKIEEQSKTLMRKIRERYELLKKDKQGAPTLLVSANLPPILPLNMRKTVVV